MRGTKGFILNRYTKGVHCGPRPNEQQGKRNESRSAAACAANRCHVTIGDAGASARNVSAVHLRCSFFLTESLAQLLSPRLPTPIEPRHGSTQCPPPISPRPTHVNPAPPLTPTAATTPPPLTPTAAPAPLLSHPPLPLPLSSHTHRCPPPLHSHPPSSTPVSQPSHGNSLCPPLISPRPTHVTPTPPPHTPLQHE